MALTAERTISLFASLFGFAFFAFYTYTFYIALIFYQRGFDNTVTGEPYVAGDLITILVAQIIGFTVFIGIIPSIQTFSKASIVGSVLFSIIEREPLI
jgi:hypothetical protein